MSDDKGERKPVSAVMAGEYLVVVCDDGSVWRRRPNLNERGSYPWDERMPIPGTQRASEKESS